MKKRILTLFIAFAGLISLRADEGMWPLVLLQKIQDPMQAAGLKLTAEDIYSINKASVKDGVVRLMHKTGRMFCTGEVISSQGLFLTNHHCGYGAIAALSSDKDNILTNGFWAKSQAEERPANFNIGFLRKLTDVTAQVLEGVTADMDEVKRSETMQKNIAALRKSLSESNEMTIEISSFYSGNQFIAMYYEIFRDIRLVGTPPENVGKFGGETDNWRWPRHTCDFSMFRIYAGADNKPADYATTNAPYKAAKYFPINLKGTKDGDFAMIMGYPGRTSRYTYSEGIKYLAEKDRPMRVMLRREAMDIMEKYMKVDNSVRLKYSDNLAHIGNYWNKFKGEATDLSKPGLYEKRKAAENEFEKWVRDNNKSGEYGDVTGLYDEAYRLLRQYGMYEIYWSEGVANSQAMLNANGMSGLLALLNDKTKSAEAKEMAASMLKSNDARFKNYYDPIEKQILAAILRHMSEDLDHAYLPETLNKLVVKFKRDYDKIADYVWNKSPFTTSIKMAKFLEKPSASKIAKDPLYMIVSGYFSIVNDTLKSTLTDIYAKLGKANRLFMAASLQMNADKAWAPDANGTMRLTYGKIMDYDPRDGVHNKTFTTAKGYLEKYVPGDFEFDAPPTLLELIRKKDYGQYADADGELHTCFLSNNDITGGNSGSPVINANGELIGIAFDGNYEAIGSDFIFMPDLQRTISVDIRFVFFIVDKLGGAKNIIDELTIVK